MRPVSNSLLTGAMRAADYCWSKRQLHQLGDSRVSFQSKEDALATHGDNAFLNRQVSCVFFSEPLG